MKLTMNGRFISPALLAFTALMTLSFFTFAEAKDDPILTKVMINQLEFRDTNEGNALDFTGQAWIGKDLHKLWIKAEGGRVDGSTEGAEVQLLYNKAIAPFWGLQVGVKQDLIPSPDRSWGVIGLQGLAPYLFEIESSLFIGESGRTGLRLEAEYELLITQRLILSPEIEVNFFGHNDAELGVGSGLSEIEAGLRLRYEIRREFAPYIGINWSRQYGNTADFTRSEGGDIDDLQLVVGIRAWF
jgi:copper resistance protein B